MSESGGRIVIQSVGELRGLRVRISRAAGMLMEIADLYECTVVSRGEQSKANRSS